MRKLSTKKILLLTAVFFIAVNTAGCKVPTNPDGSIKLIDITTGFKEIMGSENWFSAIFVWPMAQFLNKFGPQIGVIWAIGILTLLVNAILLSFTLKSTMATQQMQLLQPEMEKIQRKYEGRDDQNSKMKQAAEMQALYKKYDVNPFSMMAVQFIQFPVIIAMYQAVQRSTAVKQGSVMGLSLEMSPMAGIKAGYWGYIIIFAIMGVTQYISMSLPQKFAQKRAEEEAAKHHKKAEITTNKQQKVMQYYMMAMIMVFGLMMPAAMTIYWIFFSIVNIAKTFITQNMIDKKAKERNGRI